MLRSSAVAAAVALLFSVAPTTAHAQASAPPDRTGLSVSPIPIGVPIVLLFVPAALIFIPALVGELPRPTGPAPA
ncbi:hypothetical protein AB0K51_04715 [Kitasatospora sp. NPDC049285]|uniref:hypothetical protein n=1 Tax=Kitasatospora sp. NPDC049285 TaxID=3157096 RepID=UPI0034422E73